MTSPIGRCADQLLTIIVALLVIGTATGPSQARGNYHMLPLQKAGQASLSIDEGAHAAYIVDLGGVGDGKRLVASGDAVLFDGKPLLDYLITDRKVEHLVVSCSHPHSDHMGGIQAMFRDARSQFYENGDLTKPRFKSVTVIDNGVPDSLAALYGTVGNQLKGPGSEFRHISVTGPDGMPRNAYAQLPFQQGDLRISNIPYAQAKKADLHGRAVITLTQFDGSAAKGILDTDDASTVAIEAAVAQLKAQGVTAIDSFVVPHHGSRYHDSDAILGLGPKHAIISVNPNNQFGHPAAEVIEKLIKRLGAENVFFTGATGGGVAIGPDGVKALYSAEHLDTFALFFEQRLTRAEIKAAAKSTPELREEIAALKRVRDTIAGAPRPASGALDVALADRVRATGTIHPADFDAGRIPLSGADKMLLAGGYLFTKPAKPATYVIVSDATSDAHKREIWQASLATDIRFQFDSGLPSPYRPNDPPPAAPSSSQTPDPDLKPGGGKVTSVTLSSGLLPDGGMVFLDGGRVEITGASTELTGARLLACGAKACVRTAKGIDYQLPFNDMVLFREVLWRVDRGTSSFYLSINPRKQQLRPDFPIESIPTGKLRFGPGKGGVEALNDVVSSGDIDRSRIGDILWRADVAFKSRALGFDVLGAGAAAPDPKDFISDETNGMADGRVPEGDRWCRLYWGSGTPKFSWAPAGAKLPGRISITGPAVIARAEAMIPRMGRLERFPAGGWCAREKTVAKSLQVQANTAATTGTLGELRLLAQMQSFALWAKRSGVQLSELAAAPLPIAPIAGWTSGIRTKNVTVVRPERRILSTARAYAIHVWSTSPKAETCSLQIWDAFDKDMAALKMPQQNGRWAVGPDSYGKLDTYAASASGRIARCAGGQSQPLVDNADIQVNQGPAATIAPPKQHSLSSQLHGGVLLGAQSEARAFEQAYGEKGQLWAPDGTLLFKRVGYALHFWNPLPDSRGMQHVVVNRGILKQIAASDGDLQFVVEAQPGATVRSDLRAIGNDAGPGLEWMRLRHGADGVSVARKVAMRCTATAPTTDCVDIHDADDDTMIDLLNKIGLEPVLEVDQTSSSEWTINLNVRRVAATLRPANDVDANFKIAAAGNLARWGFRDEAATLLIQALATLSPESEDTILRNIILASE